MLKAYKISGDSMAPTLRDGDFVLTVKTKPGALRSGLIYVINHSDLGVIVKRIEALKNGRYGLIGDNPASTPSTVMGTVEPQRIIRRAIYAFGPSGLKKL